MPPAIVLILMVNGKLIPLTSIILHDIPCLSRNDIRQINVTAADFENIKLKCWQFGGCFYLLYLIANEKGEAIFLVHFNFDRAGSFSVLVMSIGMLWNRLFPLFKIK